VILHHAFVPPDNTRLSHLCGTLDEHLREAEGAFDVRIGRRGDAVRIEGGKREAQAALEFLDAMYQRAARPIPPETFQLALVEAAHRLAPRAADGGANPADAVTDDALVLHTRRADLIGRTANQVAYLRNILSHDITFGIGPAGTGKTFLAVACAVDALERSAVQRIVLTRPAVEAGERLGFLPGDLAQKVDPYLRPLYDALYDLMGFDRVTKAFEKGALEIAPLAFMRGRTLNHAFVILDEAQNTTTEQMKMFLTRIGFGSKCVVNGDVSQIDLPRGTHSGLVEAQRVLAQVRGIAMTRFTAADVVRHPLVARIVEAYDAAKRHDEAAAERAAQQAARPLAPVALDPATSVPAQAASALARRSAAAASLDDDAGQAALEGARNAVRETTAPAASARTSSAAQRASAPAAQGAARNAKSSARRAAEPLRPVALSPQTTAASEGGAAPRKRATAKGGASSATRTTGAKTKAGGRRGRASACRSGSVRRRARQGRGA
jgi:phosphate starvation-inducible PhoH-like protein